MYNNIIILFIQYDVNIIYFSLRGKVGTRHRTKLELNETYIIVTDHDKKYEK